MTGRFTTVLCLAGALFLAGPINATETPEGQINNGIEVHGHWKIEIFEPDGTLVSSTEFENALLNTGQLELGQILSSTHSVGAWAIGLSGVQGTDTHPCNDSDGSPTVCIIAEPAYWTMPFLHSTNLVVGASLIGIEMTGSVVADNNDSIQRVVTHMKSCGEDVTPADCSSRDVGPFFINMITYTVLASPPSVQAGQIIQVAVSITFS